jgi:hypothetical protein
VMRGCKKLLRCFLVQPLPTTQPLPQLLRLRESIQFPL